MFGPISYLKLKLAKVARSPKVKADERAFFLDDNGLLWSRDNFGNDRPVSQITDTIGALTAGGTALTGLATVSIPVGVIIGFVIDSDLFFFQLYPGAGLNNGTTEIQPDDYHVTSNQKYWKRILSDAEFALANHDHDQDYSAIDHDHDTDYAPIDSDDSGVARVMVDGAWQTAVHAGVPANLGMPTVMLGSPGDQVVVTAPDMTYLAKVVTLVQGAEALTVAAYADDVLTVTFGTGDGEKDPSVVATAIEAGTDCAATSTGSIPLGAATTAFGSGAAGTPGWLGKKAIHEGAEYTCMADNPLGTVAGAWVQTFTPVA